MQQNLFEVVFDSVRTDAFVKVSAKFVSDVFRPFYGSKIPFVVPLKLSNGKKDVYVGCLARQPHNLQPFKLFMSVVFGNDLELRDGETVQCTPVYNFKKAARVMVAPASVDDSEIVEQNALRIETRLLRQVQVVFTGMVISVVVFANAHSRVTIQQIYDTQDGRTTCECAVMSEGTEFVIATRRRQIAKAGVAPMWSVLRSLAYASLPSFENLATNTETAAGVSIFVSSNTAKHYRWTEGLIVGFFDLAHMSQLIKEQKVTPSFIRSNALKGPLCLVDNIPDGKCYCKAFSQASNIIIFPDPDENVPSAIKRDCNLTCSRFFSSDNVTYDKIVEVHGEAPLELWRHLSCWFFRKRCPKYNFNNSGSGVNGVGNGNVLLCGGRGYGKTTLVSAVVSELPDVHVCIVHCASSTGKQLLSSLQKALVESIMCAPSVLILEDFAAIAPAQQDGSVASMSSATRSMVEEALRCFTDTLTLAGRSPLAVIATCVSREDINERLRTASCFAKIIKLGALDRSARTRLLQQVFPNESIGIVEQLAGFMDNYTPFDIKCVSARIKNCCETEKLISVEAARKVIACFSPLSHTGVSFLKGQKQSLDSIAGLSVAKKVLYQTLVLPIKHSQLFSRLPLKLRSGVLLYGPPGCGKTFLVESVVAAADLNCIVVNGPEVFGKYIGQSEQKIRDIFERAQASAPCVVFFDEFDSVAPQRGADNSGVTDRVVNQLLCYLDGVEGRKDVYVVAASSRPDLIDAALLRPGRLDKIVECPIPSFDERLEILVSYFEKVATNIPPKEIEDLARYTENWTPADLAGLVSSAELFMSRRVIERLSAEKELAANKGLDFLTLNLGKGTTKEKIEDVMRQFLDMEKERQVATISIQMDIVDLRQALATFRPSLSAREILKYERIRSIFTGDKKAGIRLREMGKKLTLQ